MSETHNPVVDPTDRFAPNTGDFFEDQPPAADPNTVPGVPGERTTWAPPEGFVMPQPGTAEYTKLNHSVRSWGRREMSSLVTELEEGQPMDTYRQKARLINIAERVTPVRDETGKVKGFANKFYNQSPFGNPDKPHYIDMGAKTEQAAKVYEAAQHAKNELSLARQAAEAANEAAKNRAEAEDRRARIDAARTAAAAADAANAAAERRARESIRPPLTEDEKKANSTAALESTLATIDTFNNDQLEPKDPELLGELQDEDKYRLVLNLGVWLKEHPKTKTNNWEAVRMLRIRTEGQLKRAEVDHEQTQVKNKYAYIDREFQEQQERNASEKEAYALRHPEQESTGMQALHDYMTAAYEKRAGKRAKEQLELLAEINTDNRALSAFLKSGLVTNKEVHDKARGYLHGNNQFMTTYERQLKGKAPQITAEIEEGTRLPGRLQVPRYRDVANQAHNDEQRKLYNELFENSIRGPIQDENGYDMLTGPNTVRGAVPGWELPPLSEGQKKVIAYFENPDMQGDRTSRPGSMADRLVRLAQRDQLIRSVKNDPAAVAELRRRGVNMKIPRPTLDPKKSAARVDRINRVADAVRNGAKKVVKVIRRK
jgi:hypothetical protein